MARNRRQDCWQASVRISIPINANDPSSIARAQQRVLELANAIPSSSVEITHAGFGRMAVASDRAEAILEAAASGASHVIVTDGAASVANAQPEIPTFLRRNGAEADGAA